MLARVRTLISPVRQREREREREREGERGREREKERERLNFYACKGAHTLFTSQKERGR
jgi:hypothetical protein